MNNDGYDDFIIGARYDDDGGSNSGQTYLILSDYGHVNELFSVSGIFIILCPIIIAFVHVKRKHKYDLI